MKITLGTVQFGMNYGVTNKIGQTTKEQLIEILDFAQEIGIFQLDTAPGYGEAEKVIGEYDLTKFKVITKTPHFQNELIGKEDVAFLIESLKKSLKLLNINNIYGLLVHNINDCYKIGSDKLFEVLNTLKQEAYVNKIGVSVYEVRDIEMLLEANIDIDLIQMPLNVLDQRILNSGLLKKLKDKGIEIHVRSLFLQGILLAEVDEVKKEFSPFLTSYFDELAANNLSKMEGALLFIQQIKEVDSMVLGVNNLEQLQEIYCAYENLKKNTTKLDFAKYAVSDENIIDPRKWRWNE